MWVDVQNDGYLDILLSATPGVSNPSSAAGFLLLTNDGSGGFVERTLVDYSTLGQFHRGPAVADFDNDGFMDFYILLSNGPDRLMKNQGNQNHWLKVVLKGTESNASAIGAIVRVRARIGGESIWQMRQVTAGGDTLFVQHDIRPNFGLRDATVAEIVQIEWPSGIVQEFIDIAADQILQVTEPPRIRWDSLTAFSWSIRADDFRLQCADQLDGAWTNASESIITNGNRLTVTIQPSSDTVKFYRLHMP